MDIHNLKKLKVQELKDLLQERQLSTIGKKEDLITRLLESDPNHVATVDPEASTTANNASTADQTEILVKAGPDLADPSVVGEGGKEQPSSQEASIPSDETKIIAAVKTDAEVQSDIELVKSRAKRFGLELEDATLKSLRAKRFKGGVGGGGGKEGGEMNKQTFLVDEETLKKRQQKFGIVETTPSSSSNNNKSETEEGKQRTGKNNHDKGRKGGGKRQGVSPSKPMVILDEAELAKRKSRQERFATDNRTETTHA